ncbi:MAG: hypothetical protein FJ202_11455 [Gemmatimonadetes bacterium]|nr:hypothetical protein [Gemmatimonadota bacterium]
MIGTLAACRSATPPDVRCAPTGTPPERIASDYALTGGERRALTPENLRTLTQEVLWRGKVFYRSQGILRNRIDELTILRPIVGDVNTPTAEARPRCDTLRVHDLMSSRVVAGCRHRSCRRVRARRAGSRHQ